MHTWQWRVWSELPYLTCSLLEPFPHGFLTQQFAPRQPLELTQVLHPEAETYRLKQVHGNTVLTPTEVVNLTSENTADELAAADGLVSEQAGQAVWVATADCTPVLIADVATGQVAAVHAGWRGTAAKIVPQAISRLQSQGSKLADLRIAMGPAISGEVYQVSEQVATEVGASILATDADEEMLVKLQAFPNAPVLDDAHPGRVRLDVRRVNYLQLELLGIAPEQVAVAPYCTYQNPEHFFSYRREKLKKVQWSGIVSRKS